MKTKNCGVFAALAAVLLIAAMLVITCTDALTPGGVTVQKDEDSELTFSLPPGKAAIRIKLPSDAGRTILPDTIATVYYGVVVASTAGTPAGGPYDQDDIGGFSNFGTANTEVLVVEPDPYLVTVGAYSDAARTKLIAMGTSNVNASAGNATTTPPIALVRILDGTTTGTFSYSGITGVSNIDSTAAAVAVTVSPYPSLTGFVAHTSGAPLASGYHWVKATATLAKHATATYLDLVHIYGGQNSTWSGKVITVNKNMYDLTYHDGYTGGPPPGSAGGIIGTDITGVTHGNGAPKHATHGATPTRTDWTFVDWYEADLTTLWIFADPTASPTPIPGTPLYKDSTVYAKWTPAGNTINIVIVPYSPTSEQPIEFSPASETFAQAAIFAAGGNFSVTASGIATPVGWFYGDTQLNSSDTLTRAEADTAVNFQVIGPYVFTFIGTHATLGHFTAHFTVSITP